MWESKYAPKRISDIIGNSEVISKARAWALAWDNNQKQTPLLLYGVPGVGKTSLAYAIAHDMDWEVLETNASDLRNKNALQSVIGAASTESTLTGRRRLIIIDEVDGINTRDRGAIGVIEEVIGKSAQPILLIANDPYGKKISPLKEVATFLEMKVINSRTLAQHLKRIAAAEKIEVSNSEISEIIEKSRGDVRVALIDLEHKIPTYRERDIGIFKSLGMLFKADSFEAARSAVWNVDVDPEMLYGWIEENVSNEYEKPRDIYLAYEALSRAAVFEGRIMRRQSWGLRKYSMDLATAGVALAKEKAYKKFTKYRFPSSIMLLSRTMIKRALLKSLSLKIGRKIHASGYYVRQNIGYFAPIVLRDPEAYQFEEAEVALLKSIV